MAANITYHEQTDMDNIRKLREVLKTLPAFAKDYFRAIEPTTSTKTRISYAYDIRIFFQHIFIRNTLTVSGCFDLIIYLFKAK